jgi:hypothetical protein
MAYSICEADADRCPASRPDPAEVKNAEQVARILHTGNAPSGMPDETTFPIADLELSRRDTLDHSCGESGGASVQRVWSTSIESLLQQSRDMAAAKPNRQSIGVALAEAEQLRKIATDQVPGQVVFLLPDGSPEDPGHTVIRFHPTIRGGLRQKIRKAIIDEFKKNVVRS